jgi:hypothetical protein
VQTRYLHPGGGGIKVVSPQKDVSELAIAPRLTEPTGASQMNISSGGLASTTETHNEVGTMAFVRKKGKSYYLVHNVREDGRVRQVHLACLGNRPRVNDEVIQQVQQGHPDLQIDWDAVRSRASESFASPFTDAEGADQLIRSLRSLVLDMRELDLKEVAAKAENKVPELLEQMRTLRGELEGKLAGWTGKRPETQPAGEQVRELAG